MLRILILCIAILTTAGEVAAEAEISIGGAEVLKGEIFNVPVSVANVADLNTISFDIYFDPEVVEVAFIAPGSFFGGKSSIVSNIQNSKGYASVLLDLPAGYGVSGSGSVAEITFKAKGAPGAQTVLDLQPLRGVILVDTLGNPIGSRISQGFVRIKQVQVQIKNFVVVLANSIDYSLAGQFFSYLKGMDCPAIHVNAEEFAGYLDYEKIVILGGPDAYDGVGEIVQPLLTEEEADFLRKDGNRRMFAVRNKWREGQSIFMFAGYNRHHTNEILMDKKEEVKCT